MPIADLIPWRKKRKTKIPVKVREQPVRFRDREAGRPSDEFARWFGLAPFGVFGGWSGLFGPRLDMVEDSQRFEVTMELPGMDKEDVDVTLSEGRLTIRGEKREEKEHRSRRAYRFRRSREAFRRSIILPCAVDAEGVEATLRQGVLTINLPKVEGTRPKSIEVKVE